VALPLIQQHLAADMATVDRVIRERLHSEVALVSQVADYIISAGGKRLRPALVVLSSRAHGVIDARVHELAAIIEFIHTATLLHDDVVDESALRRGRETANAAFGNAPAVLVGDFLYSRAFQMMVSIGSMRVMEVLADATNTIAEGEVLQLSTINDSDATLERCLAIIDAKTAALFAAAARVGAMAAGQRGEVADRMAAYGRNIGLAFQLVDDALDYGGRVAAMGKNVGDDFREGKMTMPVALAREEGDGEERAFWRRVMGGGGQSDGDFERAVAILRRRGAIAATLDAAAGYAQSAKDALAIAPPSPMRAALEDLADFVVARGA